MPPSKKRILCVDNNLDDCKLLKIYLGWEEEKIEVIFAQTTAEALFKAKTERYDLYLTEALLPDGSGVELTARIRCFDTTTPIIFHATHAFLYLIENAMRAGAQKFIKKQGDLDDVVRTIKAYLCSS
jgi:DNA-binding NtrC family response regulator